MSIKPVLVPDHTANDLRRLMDHFADAASGPVKKQLNESRAAVAEAAGLYGPFTATINTGERPRSRTKTKKFKREDDAILWAEDWLENYPQYSLATAEVADPQGNVVWHTDDDAGGSGPFFEQGVAEGIDPIEQLKADIKRFSM